MKNFKRIIAIVTLPIVLLALVLMPIVALGNNVVNFLDDDKLNYFHLKDFVEILIETFNIYVNLFK